MKKLSDQEWHYLVYARVSTTRQVVEGDGLGSQEQRCINYIKAKNDIVEKVFRDEGVSGGLFERPAMNALLKYIDDHPHKRYVVVFDDLSRLARDINVHLRLKMELSKIRGARLECPNFNFEDSPEGEFIENIIASKAQLDRQQNRRQVIQKQSARLERGYWPFCPPPGLKHIKDKEHGRVLVSREPYASIFKEAIEAYEKNILNSEAEVKDYINEQFKANSINKTISSHGVQSTLTKALYAGYIEYQPWEIERMNGQHTGFISKETYENVQNKRLGKSKPRLNASYSNDFPLKGFVSCYECGKPLRASWNKGRTNKYPNYWCQTEGCKYRYKTTNRDIIHGQFQSLLSASTLDAGKVALAKEVFKDAWNSLSLEHDQQNNILKTDLVEIEGKIDSLVERIATASDQSLIETYEEKIRRLTSNKTEIDARMKTPSYTEHQFGTALDKVCNTLQEPLLLWQSDSLEDKTTVLYMFFENKLRYKHKEGFGTTDLSSGINLLRDYSEGTIPDVEMPGIEPGSERNPPRMTTSVAGVLI